MDSGLKKLLYDYIIDYLRFDDWHISDGVDPCSGNDIHLEIKSVSDLADNLITVLNLDKEKIATFLHNKK